MPLVFVDTVEFPFNNGRGLNPSQIDWDITDTELTALLTTLAAAGNTAYVLTVPPPDTDGADGDTAIVLVSATEVAGYRKAAGAWTQTWTFSGGGLTAAVVNALPVGDIHSNSNWPFVDADGVLSRVPFSSAVGFMRSSVGLGPELNPRPTEGTIGHIPIATSVAGGFGLTSPDSLRVVQSALRTPSADEEFRLVWNIANRELEIYVNRPHRSDTAVAAWLDIPDRNDLYIEESRAQVSGQSLNDYVWDAGAGHFYIWAAAFQDANRWAQVLPGEALAASRKLATNTVIWLGSQHSDADALNHLVSNHANVDLLTTDVFYNRADVIRRVETFTPPGTSVDHWQLMPTIRNPVPDPQAESILIGATDGGWTVGRLPQRGDSFTHASQVPAATATSPELVYLEHEYSEGVRQDGILRIGTDGNFAGYIDSRLGAGIGSINRPVPVVRIRVVLAGDTISRWDDAEFFDEGSANEFNEMWLEDSEYTLGDVFFEGGLWHRRFTTEPTGLQINTDIAFNLRRAVGDTFFLTNGAGTLHGAGFYAKYQIRDGGDYAYDHLSGPRIQHSDSVGEPLEEPTRNGQFDVDNLGRVWVGLVDRHILTTAAAATSEQLEFDQYVRNPDTEVELYAQGGNGAFTWIFHSGNRELTQIPSGNPADIEYHRTWQEVWTYLQTRHAMGSANYNDAVANEAAVWLGGFPDQQAAAEEASHIISQAAYDAGQRIFYGHSSLGPIQGVRRLITYTQGTVTERVDGHWVGPFATVSGVETLVDDILDNFVRVVADEAAAIADGDLDGVLYLFP